ncbi:MAG: hypothetical protein KC413_09180, partial [Anaerolineales bacterium]|nr:hypothetical protein [Anaerolineales bacterium]
YQQFIEQRNQEREAAKEVAAQARAAVQPESEGNGSGLSKNEQRKRADAVARLENDIAAAEQALAKLAEDLQMATQAQSFDKIQSLSVEYGDMALHLEQLLAQWEKMTHE